VIFLRAASSAAAIWLNDAARLVSSSRPSSSMRVSRLPAAIWFDPVASAATRSDSRRANTRAASEPTTTEIPIQNNVAQVIRLTGLSAASIVLSTTAPRPHGDTGA
jgi:hypothetical protein